MLLDSPPMPGLDPKFDRFFPIANVGAIDLGSNDSTERLTDDSSLLNQQDWPLIAGYKITGALGSGGMGTVYRACQLSTNRDVALKVIPPNVTRSARLRSLFTQEVRLAARLQHPNVVAIYDSGIDCGLYYYAMQLVDGETLDQYVLRPHYDPSGAVSFTPALPTREILELMRLVCQGVQHAHLRGVIHRDLKPRNIMVTRDGQPHVLDFGLATVALQNQLVETSEINPPPSLESQEDQSHHAHLLTTDCAGTPAFMSPEQTRGRPDELDIRTDVYSLGVTLYFLLTGKMPRDSTGGNATVMRKVAHEPILLPRDAHTGIDPELEALLLKALARDREHRYASAGAMADDLDRYLSGRPLLAIPHTPAYLLSKWIGRHKKSLLLAACVSMVLSGLAGYSYLSHREVRSTQLDRADYDQTLNQVIARLSPQVSGRQISYRDLLNMSADDATHIFKDRPAKLAGVLDRIGVTLLDQGWCSDAERRVQQALDLQLQNAGEQSLESIRMMNDLAEVKREVGKFSDGGDLCHRAIAVSAKVPGSEDQNLRSHIDLAYVLDDQGQCAQAAEIAQAALSMSADRHLNQPNHPDTLRAMNTLAFVLRDQGKLLEARALASATLSARSNLLGEGHPDTIRSMDVYATILGLMPNADSDTRHRARELLDKAVNLSINTLGLDHTDRLSFQNDRGAILERQGDFAEASVCLRSAMESSKRLLGDEDRMTILLMRNLAGVLEAWTHAASALTRPQRDHAREEAQLLLKRAIELLSPTTSTSDPSMLTLSDALAKVDFEIGEFANAQALYEKTLHIRETNAGEGDPALVPSILNVANSLRFQQKWSEAEPLFRRAWKILADSQGRQSAGAQAALSDLNFVRQSQQKPLEADP